MPLYEYRCETCSHTFQRIERPSAMSSSECPECGGNAKRQLGAPALQFKGSGWYVTDYAKKSTPATTSNGGADGSSGSDGAATDSGSSSGESTSSGSSSAESKPSSGSAKSSAA